MEFVNEQHKELHELLLQLGFKLTSSSWTYAYIHEHNHKHNEMSRVYFDFVEDYSIHGDKAGKDVLCGLSIDELISTLRSMLPPKNDNQQFRTNVESWGVVFFNKYTPDEVAFLDAAALVLIQVEYQGKHLTYAEAYAEAVNMLKARRECLGGEHD